MLLIKLDKNVFWPYIPVNKLMLAQDTEGHGHLCDKNTKYLNVSLDHLEEGPVHNFIFFYFKESLL